MNEYTCYTNKGSWKFYAYDLKDACRVSLFYAWRDDEIFDHIVTPDGHIVRLCVVDKKGWIETL